MNQKQLQDVKQNLPEVRRKLILSLAINGLFPVILYTLVRPLVADEVAALAIAGAVPVMRIIILWTWRRRVDWIGVLAVLGFAIALAVSAISNGNSLLLKVHEQLLTGTIGLVLLASVVIQRPLLLPLLLALTGNDFEQSSALAGRKRISVVTATLGLVLLGNAASHIILALTLSTATFLAVSRPVTWAILGGGMALLWWTRRGVGGQAGRKHGQIHGDIK